MSDKSDEKKEELSSAEKSQVEQDPPPTWVEWGARIFSLALVLGLVAYVIVVGLQSSAPIRFDTNVLEDEIEMRGDEWVVPVDITNRGGTSVEDLVVTMIVDDGAGSPIMEDLQIPLLGGSGQVRGEYWMDEDPTRASISFDISSYRVP